MIRRRTIRLLALAATGPALVVASAVPSGAATGRASAVSSTSYGPGHVPGPAKGHGPGVSLDWAGWAVTGATVTTTSGGWTQPAAVCDGTKSTLSAFWVGIDGYAPTDPTVQQIGTDSDCTKGTHKKPGGPSYYAWFELYPAAIVVLNPTTYPVAPGDSLTGTVTLVGASYRLALTDAGRWAFTTLQVGPTSPPPLDASAEWIVEAPTTCGAATCKPLPLTDFGSVAFTGATANGLPIDGAGFTPQHIVMAKNKKGTVLKASPSALSPSGTAFSVTWLGN